MSILDKVKDYFSSASSEKPALPSLDELHQMIIKSQLLFRQTLGEAEASAKKAQELYNAQFTAMQSQRGKIQQALASQNLTTKQKMAQAMLAGKNTAMLQDVEVVLEIEEAFRAAGLTTSDSSQARTLAEVQKELEQASMIVENAKDAINQIGSSIQSPSVAVPSPALSMSPELKALWDEFDRETDMAKKMDIKAKIDSLDDANKPVQVMLGGV